MENNVTTLMTIPNQEKQKIKTPFAQIIVTGPHEAPYYQIMYYDPTDKEIHIGFASYYMKFVFDWLKEEFEIIKDINFDLKLVINNSGN